MDSFSLNFYVNYWFAVNVNVKYCNVSKTPRFIINSPEIVSTRESAKIFPPYDPSSPVRKLNFIDRRNRHKIKS